MDFGVSTIYSALTSPQAECILGRQNGQEPFSDSGANPLLATALVFIRNVRKFRGHKPVAVGHLDFG